MKFIRFMVVDEENLGKRIIFDETIVMISARVFSSLIVLLTCVSAFQDIFCRRTFFLEISALIGFH